MLAGTDSLGPLSAPGAIVQTIVTLRQLVTSTRHVHWRTANVKPARAQRDAWRHRATAVSPPHRPPRRVAYTTGPDAAVSLVARPPGEDAGSYEAHRVRARAHHPCTD